MIVRKILNISRQFSKERYKKLLAQTPIKILNEYGYDPFGFHPEDLLKIAPIVEILYRYYFRVKVYNIERVPPGRLILVANHGGQLPFDGLMIGAAMFFEAKPPRIIRSMVDKFVGDLPLINKLFFRCGQVIGLPENAEYLLKNEEAILVFPEGVRGISKPWDKRYKLEEFGTGFFRLALKTKTPIIPVAVIGSEEQYFTIHNSKTLAKLFGLPAFPITLTFPLLGPIGLIPLPTKYRIYFGEPIKCDEIQCEDEADIEKNVKRIREIIQNMINEGLREREAIFI